MWEQYGLFFAKVFTLLIAVLILMMGIFVIARKNKSACKHRLEIKKLNHKYDEFAETLNAEILSKKEFKKLIKEKKAAEKIESAAEKSKKRVFVLEFNGDIKASGVQALREEITGVLSVAKPIDEVVLRLESPGGIVSGYGLAASQLKRLKQKGIPLTVAVDKVAASGGYMMACVADRILAAPFAILGSIGVIAQLPNFHRFLKSKDIDFEQITAGEYKRTLSLFGENTLKGREKCKEEVEEMHTLFKDFIQQNRPEINIKQVATGEHWLASRAIELKLVDELITSDDYLFNARLKADIYQISYHTKKSMTEKISGSFNRMMQFCLEKNTL